MVFEYCEAWPQELKDLELRLYHIQCLITCLEAKLGRIEPFSDEFNETINALDKAYAEAITAGREIRKLKFAYASDHQPWGR